MKLKIKLNAYLARFKQSKFLVFVIGMTIGISYTYLYIAGSEYYDWAKIGYTYSHEFLDSKEAEASEVSRTQGEVVQTATHQGIETPTDNISVDSLIKQYFGSQSEKMLALAKCESTLDPTRVGDKHLTFEHNGQIYGRSIGLFQVRTGGINRDGSIWTRTDNVEEFEKEMMIPEKNIEMAKKIFGNGNFGAWYNCSKKLKFLN
jgi:hypothetical protein